MFLKNASSLNIGVYIHSVSFFVSFFTDFCGLEGTYIPSTFESISRISLRDLSLLSLQILAASRFTSSPSPITIKSKKFLYGSGFALTTGPPANISGQSSSLSVDFNGILYLSSIENIVRKSISNEKENPITSTSLKECTVFLVSENIISALISHISSIPLNTHKKPSDESAKDFGPGNAIHKVKSAFLSVIGLYR